MAKTAKRAGARGARGASAKSAKSTRSAASARGAKSARGTKRAKGATSARSAKGVKSAKSARSAKSTRRTAGAARKTTRTARPGRRASTGRSNAAFMAPVTPSPALAEVVGEKPLPRTEVTKRLWAYIKKNGLQDARNRRMIKADPALKSVFGGKSSVNMFEMTKLVSQHLE